MFLELWDYNWDVDIPPYTPEVQREEGSDRDS
ncbi:hypothetical protein J2756_001980 [Methanobacterium aggregans]|nr:hypothetical protein [Methanobacterium aggregans]